MAVVGNLNSDGPEMCNHIGVCFKGISSPHNVKFGLLIGPTGSGSLKANGEEVGSGSNVHEGRESSGEE